MPYGNSIRVWVKIVLLGAKLSVMCDRLQKVVTVLFTIFLCLKYYEGFTINENGDIRTAFNRLKLALKH